MTLQTIQWPGNTPGFKALFQHAPIGLVAVSQAGLIEFVNPAAENIFGYDEAELTGQPVEILVPATMAGVHQQHRGKYFKELKARPMGQGMDLTAKRKDGTTLPVEICLGHCTTESGTLALAFIADISCRKNSESITEEEAQWHRFFIDAMKRLWNISNMEEGFHEILTTSMALLHTNMGNIQLLDTQKQVLKIAAQKGFDREFLDHFSEVSAKSGSVCGIAFSEKKQIVLGDVEQEPLFAPHLQVAKNSGFRSVQSTPLFNRDGLPIGMISTHSPAPHYFSRQSLQRMELYAGYVQSFLELMEVYEATKRANAELEMKIQERTQELADALAREKELSQVKSSFVTLTAHEFRTPMSVILSSVGLIEQYTQTNQQDKRQSHLNAIRHSIKNLVNLLDDFLSVGMLEEGKVPVEYDSLQLNDFLQNIAMEVDGLKKDHQHIHVVCKGRKEAQLDKKILRSILLNLLSNAIKYSDSDINLTAETAKNRVIITVEDRGIGIPADEQKYVFDKFFRARNVGTTRGAGLGLNIVKLYVDLLGGTIEFISGEDTGSTFILKLPNGI